MKDLNTVHREWAIKNFGEDSGPLGPLRHMQLEIEEVMEKPDDIYEYVDILFLLFDAFRRAGFTYEEVEQAGFEKMEILESRTYLKVADGQPSLHIKE